MDGGVDGLGLGGGGEVEGRAFGNGGSNIGDGDQDANGRPIWGGGARPDALGIFDLVEVAGGVVVDRGPQKLAEVFQGRVGGGNGSTDGGQLGGAFGGVGTVVGKGRGSLRGSSRRRQRRVDRRRRLWGA